MPDFYFQPVRPCCHAGTHLYFFCPPKDFFTKKVWGLKKFGDSRGTNVKR